MTDSPFGAAGGLLDCVIPAAGASSRMGDWKALLPWGSSTLLETVIGQVRAAGLGALVVAGFRGGELHELLDGREGVLVIDNPDWEAGMAGSVIRGAEAARGEAFFVCPADMPLIGPALFRALVEARLEGRPGETLFAAYAGRAGHPVLIPRSLLPAMLRLAPGAKLRDFLMSGPSRLVETGNPAVLADIDTPEEYGEASRSRGRGSAPS